MVQQLGWGDPNRPNANCGPIADRPTRPLGELRSVDYATAKESQLLTDSTRRSAACSGGKLSCQQSLSSAVRVIRSAIADRVIGFDVTLTVKLPRIGKREKADDDGLIIPEAGEVGALLSEAEDKFAAFIGLCAFAGLRLGEAAALKVSDIDFMRKQIRVDRQVQRANGGQVEIRPPKYGSNRTVYVPDGLINLLSEHVGVHVPGDNPDRWMFPGEGAHPLHQNSVGYLWRKARHKASVGVATRLHDLRHFYASGLIYAG